MAQKLIPWNTGGGNIVVNYSGSGNDTVTVGSDTDNAAFTPRSQSITVRTTAGASISRTVTVTQSGKVVPVGTIYNFAYTGTVQEVTLSAGTYKLQVWGAQGGSNAAASTYSITAQAGGKGGYSDGILTLTSPTTLYIFVGGQGSSSGNGGWNGGGGGSGSSTYSQGTSGQAGYNYGTSRMGCGGGSTDIALTTSTMSYSSYRTNRSSASLLSRFLVAGGGSGGAMCYNQTTTSTSYSSIIDTTSLILASSVSETAWIINNQGNWEDTSNLSSPYSSKLFDVSSYKGKYCEFCITNNANTYYAFVTSGYGTQGGQVSFAGGATSYTILNSYAGIVPSDANYLYICTKTPSESKPLSNIIISQSPLSFAVILSTNIYKNAGLGYVSKLVNVSSYKGKTCSLTTQSFSYFAFATTSPTLNQTFPYAGGATAYSTGRTFSATVPNDAAYLYILVVNSGTNYVTPSDVTISWSETTTTSTTNNQVGYVGGGTSGGGYSSSYKGGQSTAGTNGGFGYGANQTATNYRFAPACGGGGWYGGGSGSSSDSLMETCKYSGGGSGFVNISANSSYRPSGYTGLELDSGATYAGDTSFPSTSGSTETGHSGDGYARITCIDPNSLIPLTFDILDSGTIGWKTSNSSLTRTIQYKKNNGSWTSITSSTSGVTISVSNGDVVQFRGSSTAFATSSYYNYFTATCNFNVRGNIMSMFSNSGFESATTIPASYALKGLFYGNTYLKDASALLMPATTLTTYCYQNMFYGCTNMTGVPALPATTTQERCYYRMFYNCSNITTAPVLNAATVATYGYYQMFYGCSKLNYIKCLATSISASNAVNGWVNGVAATGTFVKASSMSSWTTGTSGIPSGWTVQNATS